MLYSRFGTRRFAGVAIAAVAIAALAPAASKPFWKEASHKAGEAKVAPVNTLPSFAALAKALSPAVVSVRIKTRDSASGDLLRDLYDRMSGKPLGGLGSGFVISTDGYIVTNNHVVEPAVEVNVRFQMSERLFKADIVGRDERTDIALLHVDTDLPLTALTLGDSDAIDPGEWVMAIGNPLALEHSVAVGVVSATGRKTVLDKPLNPGSIDGLPYANYIQTDAAIYQGNSGGPLINVYGEVIGINTAIASPTNVQGIGLAVPINMAKVVLPQLREHGHVQRSWLGIKVERVDQALAESQGLTEPAGGRVTTVYPGSPAETAGLKVDDIIISFDGKKVARWADLPWLAATAGIGRTVDVQVVRNGKTETLRVTLQTQPETNGEHAAAEGSGKLEPAVGLTVAPVSAERRTELLLKTGQAALEVVEVDPEGPAARAGIQPGDIILKLNRVEVTTVEAFRAALAAMKEGEPINLYIIRDGKPLFTAFRKGR